MKKSNLNVSGLGDVAGSEQKSVAGEGVSGDGWNSNTPKETMLGWIENNPDMLHVSFHDPNNVTHPSGRGEVVGIWINESGAISDILKHIFFSSFHRFSPIKTDAGETDTHQQQGSSQGLGDMLADGRLGRNC